VNVFLWAALLLAVWSSPAAAQANEPDEVPLVRLTFPDRPSLRVGSVLRVDFRFRVQGDVRSNPSEPDADPSFEWTRRRFGIEGTAFEHIEYEVERELRKEQAWRDVFVNVTYFDDYQVQAGKFKIPFSQERLASSTELDFVHRALVVDALSPAREIGATVHGRFNNRAVGYDAGMFRHDGENARFGSNPGANATMAGRFTARPMRLSSATGATREMEVAAAVTVGTVPDGLNSLRGRTTFEEPFFEPVYVQGRRVRLGFDADWRPGPFSLKGEFIRVTDQRKNQGIFDEDLPNLVSQGWYATASWVVTGEPKLDGIEPRAELFRGGGGALELATRVERLGFGSTLEGAPEQTNPRAANLLETGLRAWTAGVNWYVNRWVKIQYNAIRELLDDPERGPDPDRAGFWTHVLRLQFVM
jgi:phosphate-selective porin OprO/OprP